MNFGKIYCNPASITGIIDIGLNAPCGDVRAVLFYGGIDGCFKLLQI